MTTTAAARPTFGRGGESAAEVEEALNATRGGSNFRRIQYLPKMEQNETIFLRYITDSHEWMYAMSHQFVPTKENKPASWPKERSFPKSMPATCRYDDAFKAKPKEGIPAFYNDCYICDAGILNQWNKPCKPGLRVLAIACLREEVLGTQDMVTQGLITAEMVGKRVGFKDATREVEVPEKDDKGEFVKDKDGKVITKTVIEPALVVVHMAIKNYFGGLQSMFGLFGTVCDRDFALVRKYEGTDTDYQHIHLAETPNHKPGTESWKRYEVAIKEQGIDLQEILLDKATDEYFATFFDPTKEPPARESKGGDSSGSAQAQPSAPAQQQAAAPTNEVDPDTLAAMRARLQGGTAPAAQTHQEATSQPGTPAGGIDFS